MRTILRGLPLVVLALCMFLARPLTAQQGSITGTVRDVETGLPLPSARVDAVTTTGNVAGSATTDQNGVFRINVAPGNYTLAVTLVGYETPRAATVAVNAGSTTVNLNVAAAAYRLNPVVVTASKKPEKAIDAPATVSVVNTRSIAERPALTPTDHLKETTGVDIIQNGMSSSNVVVRGFNNIFSGALHFLTDYRIAGVPSLRVNLLHFVPSNNEDIERMEVVLGPGAALYGPNTANGVLHILTKSPLTSQGTMIAVGGGERSVFQGEFRTAQLLSPNFGVKVSGQYLQGNDWVYTDPVEVAARAKAIAAGQTTTKIGLRNNDIRRYGGEVRADWRATDNLTAVLQAGLTNDASSIELTGIGAGQAKNWLYSYYQARANYKRSFAQVYLNASDAGDTYTIRDGNPIVDKSKLFSAQLQHGFNVGRRENLIIGGDYVRTMPNTGGTINGRNESIDNYDELGGYLQSETILHSKLDLVLAGRIDKHSELDHSVFSPRAALVFKPVPNQTFRVTYNRAFSTPSALNLFLDIPAGPFPSAALAALGYNLRAQGPGQAGFTFRNSSGNYEVRSPFNPAGKGALLTASGPTFLKLATGVLLAQQRITPQLAAFINSLTPTVTDLPLALLDVTAATPAPVRLADQITDISGIRESTTETFEVGWKGIIADRLLITADAYHTKHKNFTSPLTLVTPFLLLDGPTLGAYLVPRLIQAGVPQAQAVALVTGMAGIPLGVVSNSAVDAAGAEALVTYRNFGHVSLNGGDIALQALLTDSWSLQGTASFVSDDHFYTENKFIALNAPKTKGSGSVIYRNDRAGFNGETRVRYTAGFPADAAVFVGANCTPAVTGATGCVKDYTIADLLLGYKVPGFRGATIQLNVQNVFDTSYQSFPGVPVVGRMALVRLRYDF